MQNTNIEILRGSYLENLAWAKSLNEQLGADHPKAKQQWILCNAIAEEMNKIKQQLTGS